MSVRLVDSRNLGASVQENVVAALNSMGAQPQGCYGATAPVPALALDFLTQTLDPRITFSRASTVATRVNSAGLIETLTTDQPRFDYDPVTLAPRGLLIEEARQNILLNATIDGANLATQQPAVALTAAPWTLSFYGTGTVTVKDVTTGTVASLTGSGAYPTRSTVTFTPAAGAIPVNGVTVTGTVQYAQLELGSFATSFIPTNSAAVTRAADVASMTGTNFSSWFNPTEGTFVVGFDYLSQGMASSGVISASDGVSNGYLLYKVGGSANITAYTVGSAATAGTLAANTVGRAVLAYDGVANSATANGATPAAITPTVTPAVVDRLYIGGWYSTSKLNGHIQRLTYFNKRLPDATLKALSA